MSKTQNKIEFMGLFKELASQVDTAMEEFIAGEDGIPVTLRESMLYSIRAGGKRLRPVMVMLSCRACGGDTASSMPPASAIEMIHTYSLIHDDLPAMDNDDFRRGKPTNHKVFGEAQAILAGDGLLTFAFEIIARHVKNGELVAKLIAELARGAGAAGMVGGQSADILGQDQANDLTTLEYIHTNKTARLFESAMKMGALCAQADKSIVEAMGNFGLTLGLAFQVVDDLLDVTSTAEKMGKQVGKDADAGKMTYPAIIGLEKSRQKSQELYDKSLSYLDKPGIKTEELRNLAVMLIERES